MRHVRRGGRYLRVADPGWDDPLDGRYASVRGGRWNPPRSFPVVYLNRSLAAARANVYRRLADLPYGPQDLAPGRRPILVTTSVPRDLYVDAVTGRGLESMGLPATYPLDSRGRAVRASRCQAIGQAAWDAGEPGIACRSAAPGADPRAEELAWFGRGRRKLRRAATRTFEDWFW